MAESRFRELCLDLTGDFSRTREHDTGGFRCRNQRRTQPSATRNKLQRAARHACLMQIFTLSNAMIGVDPSRLRHDRVAGHEAAATWPVKIARGKFHGLMQSTAPSGACEGPSVCEPCTA